MKIIGVSIKSSPDRRREPINIHPDARERLRRLLFEPELRGVGYSEFIHRACDMAESEIATERQEAQKESSTQTC